MANFFYKITRSTSALLLFLFLFSGCKVELNNDHQHKSAASTLASTLASTPASTPPFSALNASFSALHSFTLATDGGNPLGGLLLSGGALYGMTYQGGAHGAGTIFSVSADGSSFTVLHSFTLATDGGNPLGSLIASGDTLYGIALFGGADGNGTIFSVGADGSSFTVLYSFTGADDGGIPAGSLLLSGNALYGMTTGGGADGNGTIFSVSADGSSFTVLHSFTGGADGGFANGDLILSGDALYGMTYFGGADGAGTIFSVGIDGTSFTVLHSFDGTNGSNPLGDLILSGGTLYGMTRLGGAVGAGTIFSVGIDGTSFTVLHSFTGGADDGGNPLRGDLILSGGTLYGMTHHGGEEGYGAIFSIGTDGTSFTVLHSFTLATDGGSSENSSLILFGDALYGMTYQGGANGEGAIFKFGQ